ncbi:MAG: amino acid permease [Cyclobacteriaceae bacterium]|nr:amino acid permease [Cyclobacteriaceae bacterium HetDA_MAG_MS6]
MIGTGVFTSLGYQLVDIHNTWSIILLWMIGGGLALIGAFTYAELGTHFKESGGDYVYLSKIFHPFTGYLYAWVSLTVGFSAPIALSAIAMTSYLSPLGGAIFNDFFGISVILILTAIHSVSIKQTGRFQDISTLIKLLFVLVLIILGFSMIPFENHALNWDRSWRSEFFLPGFAVSLIFVSYAYVGWNSASYVVGEIRSPKKNLPKALIFSTLLVMVLYVLLQVVFLRHASLSELSGQVEVATISFSNIYGANGAIWVSAFIAIQLVATISGYLWVGSRVTHAMAKEHALWKPIVPTNSRGIPVRALWLQSAISIFLTLTGSFEQMLLYAGFVLQLMGTLTVASLLWLKKKEGIFTSPLRPYIQIIFILFSIWILAYTAYAQPMESLIGIGILVIGGITYFLKKPEIVE